MGGHSPPAENEHDLAGKITILKRSHTHFQTGYFSSQSCEFSGFFSPFLKGHKNITTQPPTCYTRKTFKQFESKFPDVHMDGFLVEPLHRYPTNQAPRSSQIACFGSRQHHLRLRPWPRGGMGGDNCWMAEIPFPTTVWMVRKSSRK